MHPKSLLDVCSELVRLTLKFDHPADAIVSRFFRDHRSLGPRERATLAETVYTVLRKKLLFDQLALSGSGPKERRLAILGFYGPRDFLKSALTEQEKQWLDQCDQVKPEELMDRHRHNLPDWLVRIAARFDPVIRQVIGELGHERDADTTHAREKLGWSARPAAESVLDTARSMIALGIVKV